MQILQKLWKIPELIISAENWTRSELHTIAFGKWKLLTCSAWRKSMNAATGRIGIVINSRAYNAISSVDMITS